MAGCNDTKIQVVYQDSSSKRQSCWVSPHQRRSKVRYSVRLFASPYMSFIRLNQIKRFRSVRFNQIRLEHINDMTFSYHLTKLKHADQRDAVTDDLAVCDDLAVGYTQLTRTSSTCLPSNTTSGSRSAATSSIKPQDTRQMRQYRDLLVLVKCSVHVKRPTNLAVQRDVPSSRTKPQDTRQIH